MRPHEHLTQLDKVAVCFVVHLNCAPRVRSSAHLPAIVCANDGVRADDGEWYFGLLISKNQYGLSHHNLLVLLDCLLVLVLVLRRSKYPDVMMGNVIQDLESACGVPKTHPFLELADFLVRQRIGLGDNGDQVDLSVEAAHKLDVDRFEAFIRYVLAM
jgi:hypothetical protein